MKKSILLSAIILSCLGLVIIAEEITLKNNQKISGKIIKETDKSVYLDIGFTILQIPREEISKIEAAAKMSPTAGAPAAGKPATEGSPVGAAEYTDLVTFITQPSSRSAQAFTATEIVDKSNDSVVAVSSSSGWGSGFIISPKGHIITNHHVIEGETKLNVTVYQPKGKTFESKKIEEVNILAFNRYFDIALLQIKEKDMAGLKLKPIRLGNFDLVNKGDAIFAFGNPGLGREMLHRTVSEGIISSRSRDLSGIPYLQTTAAINPGNSGGPVFNAYGEVIGLVTYKAFWQEGIGFALPSNYIIEFIKNMEAFACDEKNPNIGYRYCPAPKKKTTLNNSPDKEKPEERK
ncbi:MAG: trypsin-like peptidase domain-containing protein [Planctomycetota bacterium]